MNEFLVMESSWQLVNDDEWQKVRVGALYAANAMFYKRPLKSLSDIISIPSIDKKSIADTTQRFQSAAAKMLAYREQFNKPNGPAE